MLTTSGTWRCSQTCAIASVEAELKAPTTPLHAVIDHPFALGAGDVGIGFDVDVDELDLIAVIGEHLGRDQRAAVAALPGRREIAGARQQHGDLERLRLGANQRGSVDQGPGRRGPRQYAAPRRPGGSFLCHR